MRHPRQFFAPLAIGAPDPVREIPQTPSRMIHFFDPSNEKIVGKLPDIAGRADVVLGNLEDAIAVENKEAALDGLVKVGKELDLGSAALWTRVNALESPWVLERADHAGHRDRRRARGDHGPEGRGAGGHPLRRPPAGPARGAARACSGRSSSTRCSRPPRASTDVEEIASASPRMQGMSLGPADLAASRRMKTTRVGGGHPGYRVLADPTGEDGAARIGTQQDLWHYSLSRMVDACAAAGILPFYGPFGDIKDVEGCEAQFRSAFILGCVGAWSLHPVQIDIAKKVFSPDPDEVAFARKVLEAIPDGQGVHMIDGKMQDDATWKQSKVMVDLARQLAEKDAELAAAYGF